METVKLEFPIKDPMTASNTSAVEDMRDSIKSLTKMGALKGDPSLMLLDWEINRKKNRVFAYLDKDCLVDASKLASLGVQLSPSSDSVTLDAKSFSAATIQERLRISGLDTRAKFRFTVMDYKRYYNSKKSKLEDNPVMAKRLKNMFVLDMMGIFTDVLPYIQEGKQLATLTGLSTQTEGMNAIARELSLAYKRALKQSKDGRISKQVYSTLQTKYSEFMNILVSQVFPGIDEILKKVPTTKSYSTVEVGSEFNGKVVIETKTPKTYSTILHYIKSLIDKGQSLDISITSQKENQEKRFFLSGDQEITSISTMNTSVESYEVNSDGRVNIL